MGRPIRVLLDVAQFGDVHANPTLTYNRAGIHRVIEQTVRSLAAEPGVALTLCAREKTHATIGFIEAHAEFQTLRFSPARRRHAYRLSARVLEQYARGGAHPPGALPLRVINKLAVVTNQMLDARIGPERDMTPLRADVYHSTVFALPNRRARIRGARYFLTVYDTIPILFPRVSAEGVDRWLRDTLDTITPDDHVLTISEHTKHDLLTLRPEIAPERVHVTLLAADPERFYPCRDAVRAAAVRMRYGIPDAPYVLSVATLEPRKNLPHLMRTFAQVVRAERLDDLHLVLTGSKGWHYDAIFEAAGDLRDVRERILFTGYVDDADLAPLYSGALAFVYPSLYEGFGLPPLEAMQCGTPVVTSNTSSLPEVVGDAGVMVDPRDTDALAQAIADVYRDPALRADLAARGLARARQFTWARYAAQTAAAYRAAL